MDEEEISISTSLTEDQFRSSYTPFLAKDVRYAPEDFSELTKRLGIAYATRRKSGGRPPLDLATNVFTWLTPTDKLRHLNPFLGHTASVVVPELRKRPSKGNVNSSELPAPKPRKKRKVIAVESSSSSEESPESAKEDDSDSEKEKKVRKKRKRAAAAVESQVESSDKAQRASKTSRPTLEERIEHLNPMLNENRTNSQEANIRILPAPDDPREDDADNSPAVDLKKRLRALPGVSAGLPRPTATAPRESMTHVVSQATESQHLLVISSIAAGRWRVPYQWAYDTLDMNEGIAGEPREEDGEEEPTNLAKEEDYPGAYRCQYLLFHSKTYRISLRDEEVETGRYKSIEMLLHTCKALPVSLHEDPDIIVVEDNELIPSNTNNPQYWLFSDFLTLFEGAQMNYDPSEYRD